jgi:hypothetical protein
VKVLLDSALPAAHAQLARPGVTVERWIGDATDDELIGFAIGSSFDAVVFLGRRVLARTTFAIQRPEITIVATLSEDPIVAARLLERHWTHVLRAVGPRVILVVTSAAVEVVGHGPISRGSRQR